MNVPKLDSGLCFDWRIKRSAAAESFGDRTANASTYFESVTSTMVSILSVSGSSVYKASSSFQMTTFLR